MCGRGRNRARSWPSVILLFLGVFVTQAVPASASARSHRKETPYLVPEFEVPASNGYRVEVYGIAGAYARAWARSAGSMSGSRGRGFVGFARFAMRALVPLSTASSRGRSNSKGRKASPRRSIQNSKPSRFSTTRGSAVPARSVMGPVQAYTSRSTRDTARRWWCRTFLAVLFGTTRLQKTESVEWQSDGWSKSSAPRMASTGAKI